MRKKMAAQQTLKKDFETYGRVWLRDAVSQADLALFDTATAVTAKAGQRMNSSPALDIALSENSSTMAAIRQLDPNAVPVRTVSFNKSDKANWGVAWHQDRVISVREKTESDGFRNWTRKSGFWHCEPPAFILDQMLFVRIHLDDSDETNGAMEIAVGSHAGGIIPSAQAETAAARYPTEVCKANRGNILVLKMLTLHASKPAKDQSGRRVLRVDFSSAQLPAPLRWN